MESSLGIAKAGAAIKDAGNKTVDGFKTMGKELGDAMETSYHKEASKDLSKEYSGLKDNWNKDVNKETMGALWARLKSNVSEVFGNAKTNIQNKNYKNVFAPPPNTVTTVAVAQPRDVAVVPQEEGTPQTAQPPLLQSQVYHFDSLDMDTEEK